MKQSLTVAMTILVAAIALASENYRKAAQSTAVIPVDVAKGIYSVSVKAEDTVLDQFLMRRCAEFTLEMGKRWFKVGNRYHAGGKVWTPAEGFFGHQDPAEKATITLLELEQPDAMDSVIIIKETNPAAQGSLTPKAKETLARIVKAESQITALPSPSPIPNQTPGPAADKVRVVALSDIQTLAACKYIGAIDVAVECPPQYPAGAPCMAYRATKQGGNAVLATGAGQIYLCPLPGS